MHQCLLNEVFSVEWRPGHTRAVTMEVWANGLHEAGEACVRFPQGGTQGSRIGHAVVRSVLNFYVDRERQKDTRRDAGRTKGAPLVWPSRRGRLLCAPES